MPDGATRTKLLHDYHSAPCTGHLGEAKTTKRLRCLYYWRNISSTVEEFINSCRTYQQTEAHKHKPYGSLQPIKPPESKWEVVTMGFVIPLPETAKGKSGILNVVCKFSKMIRAIQSNQTSMPQKWQSNSKNSSIEIMGYCQRLFRIVTVFS